MRAVCSLTLAALVGGLVSLALMASPASATLPATEPDNTGMVNGKVRAIVQAGGRTWVAGTFTQMMDANGNNVRAVNNLAAFNASTGAPDLTINIPSVTKTSGTPIIYDMSVAPDGKVYIGGAFDKVNGVNRKNVAAFDPNTGALASFSATPANATAVLATADAVYVGTNKLVKFTLGGIAAPLYDPPEVQTLASIRGHETAPQFRDIVQVGTTLVAACQCDSLSDGGAFQNVKSVVKIDSLTGDRINWAPAGLDAQSASFGISAFVRDFPSATDRTVYLGSGGSDFTAAYDYESGAQRWKTDTSGSTQVVAWHQNTIIVGGHFQWVAKSNGQQCDANDHPNTACWHAPRLVAMDPADGDVVLQGSSPWNPGICCKYNGVWALLVDQDGGKLHVGGEFTKTGGSWSGSGTNWLLNGAQNQDYYARLFGPATSLQTLTVARVGTGTVTSSPGGINCGTACSATYGTNSAVTLTASPGPGYMFTGWGGDCSGTALTCNLTMSASRNVVATFAPVSYTLSVSKTGSGTVTSDVVGIVCGVICSANYAGGTVVTLTATPNASNLFTGWAGGGCSGTGTCVVTMNGATNVTATFAPARLLTVTKAGTGAGSVTSGPATTINCGTACSGQMVEGSTVTLTAAAASGSVFTGWSGDCAGASPTCVVTMSGQRNVTANFELLRPLSVVRAGAGSGTVTSNVGGINCGTTCNVQVAHNTVVTLTATVGANSTFTGWSGGGCSGTGTCVVTMDASKSVTATFGQIMRSVTVTTDGTGGGTVSSTPAGISCQPTCTQSFAHGTSVTLTATPNANSTFTGWSGAGCSGTGTCVVTMDTAKNVTATFTAITHPLTVVPAGQGTGLVTSDVGPISCPGTCSASYTQPSVVTLTADADPGSSFTGWSHGSCGSSPTCQVTMNQARTVTATFTVPHMLTVAVTGTGAGSVTSDVPGIDCPDIDCDDTFPSDSVVTLSAAPDPDVAFTGWSGAGCSGTGTCVVTMDTAKNVTATFTATHPLTVSKAGSGNGSVTSDVGGITCGGTCQATYVEGTVVTLTASPANGSTFTGWSGEGCAGTGPCQVTMSSARTVTATFTAAPTSSCGRILFASTRSGNPDVWVMDANGANETNLTNRSGSDTDPVWSPDCSEIAFTSTRSGNVDIYVMNADGTGTTRLTTHASPDSEPSWSPDGSKIAFVSTRTGNAEVFVMNANGANQVNETNHAATDTSPDWSPDGTTIAFDSTRGGGLNIWTMTATGGSPTKRTTGLGSAQAPAWSPSGAKIAFVSNSSGTDQIWVMNANGSGAARLTNDGGVHADPTWSPDGTKLAYANTLSGRNQIWVVNQNGGGATNTSTSSSPDTLPNWSA
jgi:hypothetical protein